MSKVMAIAASGKPTGRTVLVFGSGAGGAAAAIDLALEGWDVLFTDPYPEYIPAAGPLSYVGVSGSGTAFLIETDLELADAIMEASVIFVSTLSTAGAEVVDQLVPSLRSDHVVVIGCGGLVSLALDYALGVGQRPLIIEIACFPYSARYRSDGSLHMRRRRPVRFAATTPFRSSEAARILPRSWLGKPAESVLHAAIINPNFVVHPASVMVNVASRDREESVPQEGLTAGARRVAEEIDREKRMLLKSLRLPDLSLEQLMSEMEKGGSKSRVPGGEPLEPMLDRYLLEDCGLGLSLLAELARVARVDIPTISAIRRVLGASIDEALPEFSFGLIGLTPEQLASGGRK